MNTKNLIKDGNFDGHVEKSLTIGDPAFKFVCNPAYGSFATSFSYYWELRGQVKVIQNTWWSSAWNTAHISYAPSGDWAINLNSDNALPVGGGQISQKVNLKPGKYSLNFYTIHNGFGDGRFYSSNVISKVLQGHHEIDSWEDTDEASATNVNWNKREKSFKVDKEDDYTIEFMCGTPADNVSNPGFPFGSFVTGVELTLVKVNVKTPVVSKIEAEGVVEKNSEQTLTVAVNNDFPEITYTIVDSGNNNKPLANTEVIFILDDNSSKISFKDTTDRMKASTNANGEVTIPAHSISSGIIYPNRPDKTYNDVKINLRIGNVNLEPHLRLIVIYPVVVKEDYIIELMDQDNKPLPIGTTLEVKPDMQNEVFVSVRSKTSPATLVSTTVNVASKGDITLDAKDHSVATGDKPVKAYFNSVEGRGTLVFTAPGAAKRTLEIDINANAGGTLEASTLELWLPPGTTRTKLGDLAVLEISFNPQSINNKGRDIHYEIAGSGLHIIDKGSVKLQGDLSPTDNSKNHDGHYNIFPQFETDSNATGSAAVTFSVKNAALYKPVTVVVNFTAVDKINWNSPVRGITVGRGQETNLKLRFKALDKQLKEIKACPLTITIDDFDKEGVTFLDGETIAHVTTVDKNGDFVVPELKIGQKTGGFDLEVTTAVSNTFIPDKMRITISEAQVAAKLVWHPLGDITQPYGDLEGGDFYSINNYVSVLDAAGAPLTSGSVTFTIIPSADADSVGVKPTFAKTKSLTDTALVRSATGHAVIPHITVADSGHFSVTASVNNVNVDKAMNIILE